jgi:recombinational DNA repair protein (RecF pathway)
MYQDRGLIIKHIPYGDSSRIIKCFTQEKGLITLFVRIPKKGPSRALYQTGSFIEISAPTYKKGSMLSPKDVKWDSNIPNQALAFETHTIWLFTLELLQKSLAEEFQLTQLHERVYSYYAHLLYEEIATNPTISLLNIAASLGVIDLNGINPLLGSTLIEDLNKLGWNLRHHTHPAMKDTEIFNTELERFLSHFNIQQLESLVLLD